MEKLFFLPKAKDGQDAIVAKEIIEHWQSKYHNKIVDVRFYLIDWISDGVKYNATVGKKIDKKYGNGVVCLITYNTQGFYLVFTEDRGIYLGEPIIVSNIQNSELFKF
jgi:hypothetical protein